MFRQEVQLAQQDRLHGDISLVLPVSWQVIGYGLLALLGTAVTFLFLGSYARVETVTGSIEPDLGAAAIIPSRSGVVMRIAVRDGQSVRAGTPVAMIRVEETGGTGGTGPSHVLAALGDQDQQLVVQERSTLVGAQASRARLLAQATGLRLALRSLDAQIATQQQLIGVAQADYDRTNEIAKRGFVSRRDVQARQETLLGRQQQLATLEQSRADKQASIAEAIHGMEEAESTARAAAAGLAGNRASVAQRRYDVEASRGYTLTAPITGTVTAVTARLGQAVQTTTPLMTVVPTGARLEAQLFVPTRAAGFLSVGQEVRLQIDAFSYERFGTVRAQISRISSAAISRVAANGQNEPVYLVAATIPRPSVFAFNRERQLQPDMTLTANIITERRSLAEWLFEPILAVRRR